MSAILPLWELDEKTGQVGERRFITVNSAPDLPEERFTDIVGVSGLVDVYARAMPLPRDIGLSRRVVVFSY